MLTKQKGEEEIDYSLITYEIAPEHVTIIRDISKNFIEWKKTYQIL